MANQGNQGVTQNVITMIGAVLTTISAVLFTMFFALDLFGYHGNPYLGILFFLILPAIFVFGLLLIPVGIWRERTRRARGLGPSLTRWPRIDFNDGRQRRIASAVAVLTLVNVVIVSLAAFRGVEYMDSTAFCGSVCHTVMEPEYAAYQDGSHARVHCVACHIGPGAPWFVKAKVDGLRQVLAVARTSYATPIPSPVHSLRPARDTCEQCHWPERFTGDLVRTFRSYADDEANTEDTTVLRLHVGGASDKYGGPQGIHWHIHPGNTVEYVSTDGDRGTIPYVKLTDASGKVTEFTVEGTSPAQLAAGQRRTMDCVDCHNRPAHRFASTPERAVDRALAQGALQADVPYVRREAVAALKAASGEREAVLVAIGERLQKFYRENYPAVDGSRVARASAAVQDIYSHNIFPKMQLTFGTHPNHIGHTDFPGCFRCHDDEHKAPDGRVISQDCELCHKPADS